MHKVGMRLICIHYVSVKHRLDFFFNQTKNNNMGEGELDSGAFFSLLTFRSEMLLKLGTPPTAVPALHRRNQQSCLKKKLLSRTTPAKLNAILFTQHTLAAMRAFHTAKACYKWAQFWHSFLTDNFADFLYSAGKNNQDFVQSLVAFWISNICYWSKWWAHFSVTWKLE